VGTGVSPVQAAQAALIEEDMEAPPRARRHKLPDERISITHKFNIAGHEGYLTVGLYKNGQPGELFITMAKEGSTVSGLMDSFALATSMALQHGVPLKLLCEKFSHTRFEPSGWTSHPEIGFAKSIMDYIFRWLDIKFLKGQQQALFEGLRPRSEDAVGPQPPSGLRLEASAGASVPENRPPATGVVHTSDALKEIVDLGDAPSCHICGAIMTRNGSCYRCAECGSTSGCS
jgi:ribonucleoside-diphosphate reductase alpha chain